MRVCYQVVPETAALEHKYCHGPGTHPQGEPFLHLRLKAQGLEGTSRNHPVEASSTQILLAIRVMPAEEDGPEVKSRR